MVWVTQRHKQQLQSCSGGTSAPVPRSGALRAGSGLWLPRDFKSEGLLAAAGRGRRFCPGPGSRRAPGERLAPVRRQGAPPAAGAARSKRSLRQTTRPWENRCTEP